MPEIVPEPERNFRKKKPAFPATDVKGFHAYAHERILRRFKSRSKRNFTFAGQKRYKTGTKRESAFSDFFKERTNAERGAKSRGNAKIDLFPLPASRRDLRTDACAVSGKESVARVREVFKL